MRARFVGAVAVVAALVAASPAPAAKLSLKPADRAAIRTLLARYIPAVLERKDLRLGYALSGPQVRGTTTVREWLHGGVPVYPFPARGDRISWTLTYVEPGDVGLDMLLQPRKGAKVDPISFRIQVTRIAGAWKVNAFYPEAIYQLDKGRVWATQDVTANGAAAQQAQQRVSGRWLWVAGGAVAGAAVLVPLGLVLAGRRRARRAYEHYLASTSG